VCQTTGGLNQDFVRVGGKTVDGTLVAGAPVSVENERPSSHPAEGPAGEFAALWKKQYGGCLSSTRFCGVCRRQDHEARNTEFRSALCDALESSRSVATTNGVVMVAPDDHNCYAECTLDADRARGRVAYREVVRLACAVGPMSRHDIGSGAKSASDSGERNS